MSRGKYECSFVLRRGSYCLHGFSLDVSNEDSSSSSSENSIAEARKPTAMPPALRKPKSKSQVFAKRSLKNSSGYASHNDDLHFRYVYIFVFFFRYDSYYNRKKKKCFSFLSVIRILHFSERLNPPARFSDSRPMRQNEGNEFERRQKISSHQRRSPRRLTQETSFQIDV